MAYITQSLHRQLQQAPERAATIDGGRRRTWRELGDRVARFAGALKASGIGAGDRVALLARNGDHYLEYLLGTFWAGGVINPVNWRWTAPEMAYGLQDCATGLLIIHADFADLLEALRREVPGLHTIVWIGEGAPDGTIGYEEWIAAAKPCDDALRSGDDLAAIMYTSGTTGRPKGVMLSHGNIIASAAGYCASPGGRPGERFLFCAPLFHIGALSGTFASLLAGSTHVFLPMFEPAAVLETIEREQVTDAFLVPTMMRALLNHPSFVRHRRDSVERIIYGASAIDDTLMDEMLAAFPGVGFTQAYGMTELSPIATMLTPDDHSVPARAAGRGRSAGRSTIMSEVRIVGADDREVPRGEVGEIVVRGPIVMLGYWGLPDATAEALRGGWMHTGDVGRMDADGYVTVVDRLKDMIITGGENVYSVEVESALTTHPAVAQAAVVGLPDDRWGEAVHAVVVLHPGVTCDAEALRAHCRPIIAGYKVPKSIELRDALPLSGAGKVLKTVLRDECRARTN